MKISFGSNKRRRSNRPKGKHSTIQSGKRAGMIIGFIFIVVGLVVFYFLGVRPFMKSLSAKDWTETPCRIISAEVGSHSSDDGTTYSIDITYEYQVDGKKYRSDRYDFIGGSSSGRQGKQRVVDQYRQMSVPICYVDPDNPSEAVLVPGLTLKNAIGLFPLIFVAAGAAVVVGILKKGRRDKRIAWLPAMKRADDDPIDNPYAMPASMKEGDFNEADDSISLAPKRSGFGKLMFALVFCLFWNGIVSVFVYQMIEGFRHGDPEWFLVFFLIPFELIGLATIGWVFYSLLAMFNPRFTLTLTPSRLYPGMVGQIHWQSMGRTERIDDLKITLTGREEATYRVGTNTKTATHTFYTMDLFQTTNPHEIARGEVGFGIPSDTMHSFEAANNKIIWSIQLAGDIARWPDVKQEYQLTLRPQELTALEARS